MSSTVAESQAQWAQYYAATSDRPPREFLRRTLRRFDAPGTAIDLGCGTGTESLFLLKQGWQVWAIDQQEAALRALLARVPAAQRGRLHPLVASFEGMTLPQADLIWAGLSLPFCPPAHFEAVWQRISAALVAGGRFAGDFFGPRHVWADQPTMTICTKEQIIALCDALEIETFIEEEGTRPTVLQGWQQIHMFTLCARRP